MDDNCASCKHRQKPNGQFPQRGWCSNSVSPYSQQYVYKGDSCGEFESLKPKRQKRKKSEKVSFPLVNGNK